MQKIKKMAILIIIIMALAIPNNMANVPVSITKITAAPNEVPISMTMSWGLKYATQPNGLIRAFDSPITADTNNDGKIDSLFIAGLNISSATSQGIVIRYNSSTGAEVWRRDYIDADASDELNPIELYDVTGDGCPEVFCHFGASNVGYQVGFICLNGLTGATVWFNQSNVIRPAWHHFVIIADKATNIPYIFFNSHPVESQFYMRKLDARTGVQVASIASGGSCNGGLSAADLDNDGNVELVLGLHSSPGFAVYNTNLNLLWSAGFATLSSTQCTKLIDICGDSTLDLISLRQCDPGQSTAGLNVVDGGTHQKNTALSVTNYNTYGWPSSAHECGSIADYDNDGFYEITSGYASPTYAQLHEINSPPELDATLTALGVGAAAPYFADLTGDSRFELVYTGQVIDTINFQTISGIAPNQWAGMMNDIDNDGLSELFGSRNGQLTVYNTDKVPVPGINTGSSHYGYRRLNSQIPYQECPGTMWYTWEEWREPSTHLITPKNQTTNVNKQPKCRIWANDSDGDTLTINFYENSTGGWIKRQKNSSAANQTFQWNYTQAAIYGTKYYWKATIDDGTTNRSSIYYFTTKAAAIVYVEPGSKTVSYNESFVLNISCTPSQPVKAFEFKVSFDPSLLQANAVTKGDIFKGYSTFFNDGTIDNDAGTINDIYGLIIGIGNVTAQGTLASISFTAKNTSGISIVGLNDVGVTNESAYIPITVTNGSVAVTGPNIYLIIPKNQSTNVNKQPKCRVWANDTAGGTLTVNFYSNSTGSWIKRQKNSSVPANSTIQWNYTQATANSTKYWWKVTIYDGTTNISRRYCFTTVTHAFYVSSSAGSDSNSGNSTAYPWKTIGKVNTALNAGTVKAGDDIYFKRGDVFNAGTSLNVKTGGGPGNWMIIGAYGTGVKPRFNHTDSGSSGILLTTANVDYVKIENIHFSNISAGNTCAIFCYNNHSNICIHNVDVTDGGGGFFFNQTNYPCVQNCTMKDLTRNGICFYGSLRRQINNGRIINCTLTHVAYGLPTTDCITIHVGDMPNEFVGANFLIKDCVTSGANEQGYDCIEGENVVLMNCTSYGNQDAIATGNAGEEVKNLTIINYLSYNENYSSTSCGALIGNTYQAIVRNSIFFNEKYHFFNIYENTKNITVYNCDFIHDGASRGAALIDFVDDTPEDVIFKNNIILSLNSTKPTNRFLRYLGVGTVSNTDSNWSHNIWWRGDGGAADDRWWYQNGVYYDFEDWAAQPEIYGELKADPLLVDPVNHNFFLQKTSPCIDAGENLTQTNGGGSGTSIVLDNAHYFYDGFSMLNGDIIFVGDDENLMITEVVYATNTITVNRSITWSDNDPVGFPFTGSAPDIGAMEYCGTPLTLKYATTRNTINTFDPPITADMNGDGKLDSLFAGGMKNGTVDTGIVLRINSYNGTEVWRREKPTRGYDLNPLELYDITGDGVPELFSSWGDSNHSVDKGMICLNAVNGSTIWINWNAMPAWHHFVIIADKQTNVPYIYFNGHNSTMNKMYATNGTIKKIISSGLSCNGGLSAADLENDGNVEIILSLHSPPGIVCYTANLSIKWQANVDTNSSTQCGGLVDVTGDGVLDVVTLFQCEQDSHHAGLTVIDGATGTRIANMSSYNLGIDAHSQGSIADIDSDGYYEITTGYGGYQKVLRIKNPPEIIADLSSILVPHAAPQFVDLVNDSYLEILGVDSEVIDGRTFNRISGLNIVQWRGMINDIDGDGLSEFFGARKGRINVYDTNKTPVPGINTYTSDYGYRRLYSATAYDPCPGTYWYSWDEWREDREPTTYLITPKNQSIGLNKQPNCKIWANDSDNETIAVTFYSNSTGSWIQRQHNPSVTANTIVEWNYSQATLLGTKYYWKAAINDGATNITRIYYFTIKGTSHIPTTYLITPKNQTTNVNKQPKCRIWANDTTGGTLTINFYSNSTGSWIKRQLNSSMPANSTVQWNYSQASSYSTKYWWRVTVNDSTTNITRLYYFITKSGPHVPTAYLITPKNQSIDINKQPKCRIRANDSAGGTLTINFYENSTGSWIKRQKNSSVTANTTIQWNYTQATSYGIKYYWKATIYDGTTNITRIYYFTTKYHIPITYLITPKNQSTGLNKQPNCNIWANDTAGGTLTVTFYENSTGIWIERQQNPSVTANTTVQWNYTQATANSTKYWWKVTIDDGITNISRLYYFITKSGPHVPTAYLITPKNQSIDVNKQQKCRIRANDSAGGTLTINFYENTTTLPSPPYYTWIRRQKNASVANLTVQWNYTQATSYGIKYYWKTTIDDGTMNITRLYYFTTKYHIPITYLITPKNQSTGLNKQPNCEIWANDTAGGTLTVTFYENSTGIWVKRQQNPSVTANTTVQWNYTQATSLGTKYCWKTTIDDGTTNISKLYYFTIKASFHIPTTYLIIPKNQTTNRNRQPKCRIWANDTQGGTLTINFYANSTGGWIRRQKNSSTANQTFQWNYSQAASYSTKYWWKTTIYDGTTNITQLYYFTTKSGPHVPTAYLITPKNQTTNINKQPKCRIWANDTAGGTLTVNFYENSTGSWIKRQRNASVLSNSTVQWNYSQASSYSTKYWWKTTIYDGTTNITRLYYFIIKSGPHVPTAYLITPKNQSTNLNKQPKCRMRANDSQGGILTVNFYENSTGSWIKRQLNSSAANQTFQWNYSQAISNGIEYWWKVTIYDGTTNITRLYYFIVKYINICVAITGNDITGDGSLANPFRSIQRAVNISSNGNTILVGSGTYYEKININKNNETGGWLTIMPYNNGTVIVNGRSVDGTHYPPVGIFNILYSNNIRISHLVLYNSSNGGVSIREKNSYIRIDNCTINNCSGPAIYVHNGTKGISNLTFDYNWVNDTLNNHSGTGGGQESISIGNASYVYIHHNRMTDNGKITIDLKDGTNHAWIYNNKINTSNSQLLICGSSKSWCSEGIYIDARGPGKNISIYNNMIWGNGTGIAFASETSVGYLETIKIYNNVINQTGADGGHAIYFRTNNPRTWARNISIYSNTIYTGPAYTYQCLKINCYRENIKNVLIYNNIFVEANPIGSISAVFIVRINSTDSLTGRLNFSNNIYYRFSGTVRVTWADTYYMGWGNNSIVTDPQFVKRGKDFHLNATSPAINNATSSLVPSIDFDGVSRPQGGRYDVGAYEFATGMLSLSNFQISGYTIASGHKRHAVDNLNFSATITNVTAVYINIVTPKGNTINQSMLLNHSAITNSYWCNRNFSNGKNHAQTGYGWPDVSCGNGTYQVYVFAKGISGSAKSSTNPFNIYPNADVTMDNYTTFFDLTAITGSNWGAMGPNRFYRQDANGDGYVNFNDLTYVSSPRNWGWSNTP